MAPEVTRPSLADQPWFKEFLGDRGFQRSAPGTFTNGRATVRVEGSVLLAIPGDGSRQWRSELKEAPASAIRQLLSVVLAAPSFLSQSALDQKAEKQRATEAALAIIAETIRLHPETHSGIRLRQLVWSIFNQHHSVNLWRLKDVLDSGHNAAVTQVLQGWMGGHLSETAIRDALVATGEMERWDTVRLRAPEQKRLVEAFDAVTDVLKSLPPSAPVTQLTRAEGLIRQVLDCLREVNKS